MNELTIKAIKEDLAPPDNWSLEEARKYRKALRSKNHNMYAPIGVVGFRVDIQKRIDELNTTEEKKKELESKRDLLPPDSFPFYKFSEEKDLTDEEKTKPLTDEEKKKFLTDEEILERARQIYELMGKFNPFSYQNYSSRIRRAIDLDQTERIKSLKRKSKDLLSNVPKRSKRGVPKQRFILNTNAKTFCFDASQMVLGSHPLVGSIKLYLQKLENEQELREMKIMRQIDDELVVFMETGTPGKYINAFSLDRVGKFKDFESDDYKKIFPAIDLPNVEYKKWKRYAANVRKLVREEQELKEELENMYGTFPEVKTEPPVESEYDSPSDDDEMKSSSTLSREDMEENFLEEVKKGVSNFSNLMFVYAIKESDLKNDDGTLTELGSKLQNNFLEEVKKGVVTFSTLLDRYDIKESDLKKDGKLTELGSKLKKGCVKGTKDAVKILMFLGGLISVEEVDKDIQTLKDKVLKKVKNTDKKEFSYNNSKKPLGCAEVLKQIAKLDKSAKL